MLGDSCHVLLVAICKDGDSALSCWKAQSLRELFIEIAACQLIPFSDDKTNEELGLSLVSKI